MSETIRGDQALQRCVVCGKECYLDNRAEPAKWACACGWQSCAVPGKEIGSESVPVLLGEIGRLRGRLADGRGGCGQPGHVTAGGSEGTCWCETCRADDLKARLAAAEADAAEGRRLALAPCPTEETMGRFFDDLCAWAERKPAERDHVDRDIWEGLVTRHAFERDVYRAVLEDGEYERVDQMPDELGLAGARMLGKLAAERTKALRKKCQLMTEAFAAIMHLYHGMSCDDDRLEWAKIGRRAVELAIAALAEEVKP